MATNNITLPEPLLAELQSAAQTQHRSADEIAAEAVGKYLKAQKWTQFVERNNERAVEMGITEEDIPHLIAEVRQENKQRGRE